MMLAAMLLVAGAAQADEGPSAPTSVLEWFVQYAQSWCAAGDAQGCEVTDEVRAIATTITTQAPLCAAGDADACDEAWSARKLFWDRYGRLPWQPDMMPGPNGEPPARAIWDQTAPDDYPGYSNCLAFMPECGFFGDPALRR